MPPPPGFEERLQAQFQSSGFIGMGVACLDVSGVRYLKGFGFADKEAGVPYTPETLQPIASISKVLIGLALMRAQEPGLLHLDDRADQHLPFALSHPWHPEEAITLRQLASHSCWNPGCQPLRSQCRCEAVDHEQRTGLRRARLF